GPWPPPDGGGGERLGGVRRQGVGAAVEPAARRHQPPVAQPEGEHGARRRAHVGRLLGADEDDARAVHAGEHSSGAPAPRANARGHGTRGRLIDGTSAPLAQASTCFSWLMRLARRDLRRAAALRWSTEVLMARSTRPCTTFWYLAAASKSPFSAAATAFLVKVRMVLFLARAAVRRFSAWR